MSIVIELDATADENGTIPLPKLIGPFPSADEARVYMGAIFPKLYGHWGLAFMESSGYASRLSTCDPASSDLGPR